MAAAGVTAGTGTGTGRTTRSAGSSGAVDGGGGGTSDVRTGSHGYERAQRRASRTIYETNLSSFGAGGNSRASTSPTLLSSEQQQHYSDQRDRYYDHHSHKEHAHSGNRHHHHQQHPRRSSPSRPLPNVPLRPAPHSSQIRCPIDLVNSFSSTSVSLQSDPASHATTATSSNTKSNKKKNSFKGNAEGWTRARLERERDAFFDTRVTGAPEVWTAVRFVAELVRGGDLATAQGVLDAAGCTCPTGELARGGVYDERGRLYEVPDWVVGDPGDLVVGEVELNGGDGCGSSLTGKENEDRENVVDNSESDSGSERGTYGSTKSTALRSKRDRTSGRDVGDVDEKRDKKSLGEMVLEKGDMGKIIKVRVRLSDRAGDLEIGIGSNERVRVLVAKVQEKAKLSADVKIRIVYLGRMMLEQESLSAQGWREGHIVNGLVFAG